jgi:4-hydroxy-4-methyl-2-oxoglutarate aldolase
LKMEACNHIGPDEVAVWAGSGSGVCYFGELIALGLQERGCAGSLVDGGVRDVRTLRAHDFTVFGQYTSAVQSIGRWKVVGYQKDVLLPGATIEHVLVRPGDFVLGDEDGAIVIPSEIVLPVLERAEAMTVTEAKVREAIAGGMTLSDALLTFGHV